MSDYETIQKRRNVIVGLFVIIALCALSWMVFKFGGLPVFVSELRSFKVIVQFPTAPGVQENTPVRFCGYQIGRVTEIRRPEVMEDLNTHEFYHQMIVILGIDKEYDNIPKDVEVKLMTRGLGSSYIELKLKHYDVMKPSGEFLVDGSILQGSTGMTSEFFPEESQKKLDELITGIGTFVSNANDVIGDPANKENVKQTMANLSEASKEATLALREVREFAVAGVSMSEQLGTALDELRTILEKINSGDGTAAKLVNDGRLYENLLENSQQLEVLLNELRSFIAKSHEKGMPIKIK